MTGKLNSKELDCKTDSDKLSLNIMEILKPLMAKDTKFKFSKPFIDNLIQQELKKDITSIATLRRVNEPQSYAN